MPWLLAMGFHDSHGPRIDRLTEVQHLLSQPKVAWHLSDSTRAVLATNQPLNSIKLGLRDQLAKDFMSSVVRHATSQCTSSTLRHDVNDRPPLQRPTARAKAKQIAEPEPDIAFNAHLRGQATAPRKKGHGDQLYVGGLRRAALSVNRLPSIRRVGKQLRGLIDDFVEEFPQVTSQCLQAIGNAEPGAGPADELVQVLRQRFADALGARSAAPLLIKDHDSDLCGDILEAWAAAAHDPDVDAPTWPRLGAPAGIRDHPASCGIFPPAVEPLDNVELEEATFGDPLQRQSYAGVERCEHALTEVKRLHDAGYLDAHTSLSSCTDALDGETPVVSKFGQIIKPKPDGSVKRRLILDAKESGVTPIARKNERILLPSVSDLVWDALHILQEGKQLRWFVMDIKDAFWTLPTRKRERRFLTGKLKSVYYIFRRLAQGSRGPPGMV